MNLVHPAWPHALMIEPSCDDKATCALSHLLFHPFASCSMSEVLTATSMDPSLSSASMVASYRGRYAKRRNQSCACHSCAEAQHMNGICTVQAIRSLLSTEFPDLKHVETSTLHRGVAGARHNFLPSPPTQNKLDVLRQVHSVHICIDAGSEAK